MGYSVETYGWSILSFFYHLVSRSQFNPQTIFVKFRQLKKIYIWAFTQKRYHPCPLPQQGFCNSLQIQFETSWALLGRLNRGFVLPSQGPLILNILNSFSWPFLDLACWLCESFLVESPILYLAFFKTILAALFRTFGLPIRFLSSRSSFLRDHFTPNIRIFPVFFSSFYNR